jgi:hypothetical protein
MVSKLSNTIDDPKILKSQHPHYNFLSGTPLPVLVGVDLESHHLNWTSRLAISHLFCRKEEGPSYFV